MMDDLVKRLASWGTAAGLGTHFLGTKSAREDCAEAAAALAEAQATIARQQIMLDRALEGAGDKMVEIARLREGLSRINDKAIMNAGEFARYVRNECAALEAKHG